MPASIADLLRAKLRAEPSFRGAASAAGLPHASLWHFVHKGKDITLATAENLMASYKLVVVSQADAEAAGISHVRPAPAPEATQTKPRRAKGAQATRRTTPTKRAKKSP